MRIGDWRLQIEDWRLKIHGLEIGDCRFGLGIGDWRLIDDWRLAEFSIRDYRSIEPHEQSAVQFINRHSANQQLPIVNP
jgi:hypothetical protein